MSQSLQIYELRPVYLTLDRIGPFQDKLYEIDFTNQESDPCNFYMIVAANGFGKTTVLDTLACLLGLIGENSPTSYNFLDMDKGDGRAQLDLLLRYHWQGKDQTVILSIICGHVGDEVFLKTWTAAKLEQHNATGWHHAGFTGKSLKPLSSHSQDNLIRELLATIRSFADERPDDFNQSAIPVPTVLAFSAYRDIPAIDDTRHKRTVTTPEHWGYKIVQKFSAHNSDWDYSLDGLLVWLDWLNDGRFENAQEVINKHVFSGTSKLLKEVQRDPPQAIIEVDSQHQHSLDRLSSGEKNLVQLFLRIGAHMTKNTILLIDEFDVHLHIRWQYKLFNALKDLASQTDANFSIIITTHSTEILETYTASLDIVEEGVTKGGHLINNLNT